MMLLLDIGNTSVKWSTWEEMALGQGGRFQYVGEDFNTLAQAAWDATGVPEKIMVSNVAGRDMGELLAGWAQDHWGVTPEFAQVTGQAHGVTNAYARPTDLGVDRWAALIGAHATATGSACIIIDCGTAITLDFLAPDGVHRGGMILPGVEMLQRILLDNTADINLSESSQLATPLARGTAAAVHGGAMYTVAAAIDRAVADMALATEACPEVIITGGDADKLRSLLSCPTRHDADLVLKGLVILGGES